MRREFTSNVSHELKTPLTSISGFAELMKSGGVPPDTAADFSSSIYFEAQRLITLVNDIIKISELDEKSVTLSLIGDKTEIIGVRKILEEIIYNLCDNAIKYNKDGGAAYHNAEISLDSAEGRGTSVTVSFEKE